MPTLNWIGKDKIVNHDKEVSFRLLRKNQKLSLGKSSGNLIVEGDNLEALKALMPFYYGKVKCIYIDPPYNTGNEGWVYNDRVNAPKIKEWFGKTVGAEGEDLSRHDKWLCMMYPRLKLLRDLLRDDGAIFVSIDDNEHCNLRMVMDEIFGEENFVATIIRQTIKGGTGPSDAIRYTHDYVMAYVKDKDNLDLKGLEAEAIILNLKDEKGLYARGRELNKWGAGSRREDSPTMWFAVPGPKRENVFPIRNDGSEGRWRWGKKKMLEAVKDGEVIFEPRGNGTYIVYEKVRENGSRKIFLL